LLTGFRSRFLKGNNSAYANVERPQASGSQMQKSIIVVFSLALALVVAGCSGPKGDKGD
jgi:hypothetical protein